MRTRRFDQRRLPGGGWAAAGAVLGALALLGGPLDAQEADAAPPPPAFEAPRGERDLTLELIPSRVEVRTGDPGAAITVQARITNAGEGPARLMKSRDGSDVGWVMPRITARLEGPGSDVLDQPFARCGNVNSLSPDDVIDLAPGESFDPLASWSHYDLVRLANYLAGEGGEAPQPGTYRVQLVYDLSGEASGAIGDSGALPAGVLPVRLVSNVIEIEVLAAGGGG